MLYWLWNWALILACSFLTGSPQACRQQMQIDPNCWVLAQLPAGLPPGIAANPDDPSQMPSGCPFNLPFERVAPPFSQEHLKH
jgi:hypothetical protein